MFCKKCGKELEKGEHFCSNCGTAIKTVKKVTEEKEEKEQEEYVYKPQHQAPYQPQYYPMYKKPKAPGNGLSIAGMVLGIIGAVFGLIYMIMMFDRAQMIKMFWENGSVGGVAAAMSIIPGLLGLTGLPLSIAGMVKKTSAKNIAGLILCSIAIIFAIIIPIYVMATYG